MHAHTVLFSHVHVGKHYVYNTLHRASILYQLSVQAIASYYSLLRVQPGVAEHLKFTICERLSKGRHTVLFATRYPGGFPNLPP